jgi:hypothetical protein
VAAESSLFASGVCFPFLIVVGLRYLGSEILVGRMVKADLAGRALRYRSLRLMVC